MNEAYGPITDEVRSTSLLGNVVEWALVDIDIEAGWLGQLKLITRGVAEKWLGHEGFAAEHDERHAHWQKLMDECNESLKAETLTRLAEEKRAYELAEYQRVRDRGGWANTPQGIEYIRERLVMEWTSAKRTTEAYEPKPAELHRGEVVSVFETGLHVRHLLTRRLWHLPIAACCHTGKAY